MSPNQPSTTNKRDLTTSINSVALTSTGLASSTMAAIADVLGGVEPPRLLGWNPTQASGLAEAMRGFEPPRAGLVEALAWLDLTSSNGQASHEVVGFEISPAGLWTPDDSGLAASVPMDVLLLVSAAKRAAAYGARAVGSIVLWWVFLNIAQLESGMGAVSHALAGITLLGVIARLNRRAS